MFTLIDFENWERKEHYLHFYNDVRCSYSTCVNIDISNLNGQRLYPAMLWLLEWHLSLEQLHKLHQSPYPLHTSDWIFHEHESAYC